MTKYLIEVSHEAKKSACRRAVKAFYRTGSHFLTHADWGCPDDEHKAWITVEVETREDAMRIVPPEFRADTRVIELQNFDVDEIEEMGDHGP
jgi:hypothetical protein